MVHSWQFTMSSKKDLAFTNAPIFLIQESYFFLENSHSKYVLQTVCTGSSSWPRLFCLLSLALPYNIPYVVDGAQYQPKSSLLSVQYNTNFMLTDTRLNVFTNISTVNYQLVSVSALFSSVVWLERELSDFTNLNYIGLSDTRRLLLDYFEEKQVWQTHISNDKNYNNSYYDISLAF